MYIPTKSVAKEPHNPLNKLVLLEERLLCLGRLGSAV